ncbi:carboxypeptidase regulatory-like domain-containing protein [Fulvivirga sedimenti]|uniref:Carboxypeptidase regulatory-like domain-containing protein n=1 Tax=Fulvivirga sedimenti TaxID=2879465 RepID=A0A9X1HUU2_9BACT|nr:carboxypeptidase regulatory-like domain-containing protein [Fulvivirga sedimenti]MCA6075360.1 carboxypeptidase regulatory-like domain-containing protein [Fulvivirga sedimenti]MCA6076537.1 carboxypeptidase regulatory-like domain-containing protein [Fulvivirga sedimenti]MCA6077665.1 carboxypeptidase regulatory-like domain-containing protein [Fulvivirga sedimenti]
MKKNYFLAAFFLFLLSFASADAQVFNTSIRITVLNELGNPVEKAAVRLYVSEEDYRNETNPATEVYYTDDKGQVKIKDLEARIYYVNAEKGDKNNIGAGVMTDKLEEKKLNKITIIIE